jgi:HAD superfamily hydrolase (TIGR01662 family)
MKVNRRRDMLKNIQAVFLDRDGTIGGTGHFIHPKDFELYPSAQESINLLKKAGLKVFALTNQYRISRGEASLDVFKKQFDEYGFDQSYICPHEIEDNCNCRKPKTGMLIQAAKEYNLDLTRCAVIGDVGDTDMLAAHEVGAIKILVLTGWGESSLRKYRHAWASVSPDYIAKDIKDATNWIIDGKLEEDRNFT